MPQSSPTIGARGRRRLRPAAAVVLLSIGLPSCASDAARTAAEPASPAGTPLGVVAAATPEATAAGLEILAAGGNAVDAAVAVSLALGVTEPAGSGIGGQTFFLVHPPGGPAWVVHGSTRAPGQVPADATRSDLDEHRATTVPSTLWVLDRAWRRFGSGIMSWAELCAPAARFAEDGFQLGAFRLASLSRYADAIRASPTAAAVFLAPDGSVPAPGSKLRRPALARTLRRIAAKGALDFYRGEIAEAIAADMRANGGHVTYEDLARFPEPAVGPALHGTYRGHDVYTLPPPTGGWVALCALNILEQAPSGALGRDDPRRTIWLAEALRAALGARRSQPVDDLGDYEDAVNERIDKGRARAIALAFERPGSGETTHFSVVDRQGLAVSVTQSLNAYFGARVMSKELGFLYNDYMHEFELGDPAHPYALRAGGLPYSSMTATIVAREGQALLAVGSPGSSRIISAVVQVVSAWADAGLSIEDAVAAPRLHVVPADSLLFERRLPSRELVLALEARGFRVSVPEPRRSEGALDPYFGGVHAVARKPDGVWHGAADPRRDGIAATATLE